MTPYCDRLYGSVELPDEIHRLAETEPLQRLKHISQDALPRTLVTWVPSRFEHSLGVRHLASLIARANKLPQQQAMLLEVAALFHDAGMPPFSHTGEKYLQQVTEWNGESFLRVVLDGSIATRIIRRIGLEPVDVVAMVQGKTPFSKAVKGCIDADNADNVMRYLLHATGETPFSAEAIAQAFRWTGTEWALDGSCFAETEKWRRARKEVYGIVYSEPNDTMRAMLDRALSFALEAGFLDDRFFRCTDDEAFGKLRRMDHVGIRDLMEGLRVQELYRPVYAFKDTAPNDVYRSTTRLRRTNHELADRLGRSLNVRPERICVQMCQGKDDRQVTLPFLGAHGVRFFDGQLAERPFRLTVYMHQEVARPLSVEQIKACL